MIFPIVLSVILSKCLANIDFKIVSDYGNYSTQCLSKPNNNTKLLVILVDAFRWDYADRDKTLKGFPLITAHGVHAKHVVPIFPPNSYPNWYAISTGLYGESHGIIHNFMYDNRTNEYFLMAPHPNVSHPQWWNQTEPLWINAVKQGIKTSMYAWDGCQVTINGLKASFCYQNKGYIWSKDFKSADNKTRSYIKMILNDFSQDKYRLSFLYHEIVDHLGHTYGPSSNEVLKAVQQIDAILYDLFNEIIDRKLDKTVNVVIVSDHGMTDLKDFVRIQLEEHINFRNIELMLGWSAISQIIPKPGKTDEVYNQLMNITGIKAYKNWDIPDEFHYKQHRRALPILARARHGYHIDPPKIVSTKIVPNNINAGPPVLGDHGYRREESDMHAIMYGFGPAFKKNFKSPPLDMVDHYNLFCHILGITPHPNNGSFDRVKLFLKEEAEMN